MTVESLTKRKVWMGNPFGVLIELREPAKDAIIEIAEQQEKQNSQSGAESQEVEVYLAQDITDASIANAG